MRLSKEKSIHVFVNFVLGHFSPQFLTQRGGFKKVSELARALGCLCNRLLLQSIASARAKTICQLLTKYFQRLTKSRAFLFKRALGKRVLIIGKLLLQDVSKIEPVTNEKQGRARALLRIIKVPSVKTRIFTSQPPSLSLPFSSCGLLF